ncbi:MAG: patatin-like phospholipase family protein [Nanoarchaeota archaeon]
MPREIRYHEKEEDKDDDWNLIRQPIILKKKTVSPKKSDKVLDYFPELKPSRKKKVAVVLSGGGAKGLAHVGVLRELEKYSVDIDFIAGTSMGAIIGALYALEGNLDLVDKYLSLRTKDLFSFSEFSFSFRGMIKGVIVEDVLRNLYGNATFKDTKIPLVVNATDLETGKEVIFKEGKIIDAVRASMSIPVIFKPKKINGRYYVDGGIVNNIPYNHVPKKYKTVIVVNVNAKIPPLKPQISTLGYLHHLLAVTMHNASRVPDDKRIIHVTPHMKNVYFNNFDKLKEALKAGRKAALDVFPNHFMKDPNYIENVM